MYERISIIIAEFFNFQLCKYRSMLQGKNYNRINLKSSFHIAPFRRYLCFVFSFLLLFLYSNYSFADGSKELNANGGYRAYLLSSNTPNLSFPFPTPGTMKVYVKAGETIYVGSSAQGVGKGTINLIAPDGSTYTSGTSTTIGLIANRAQEVAGPMPNAGGYTPFKQTVQTGQDGVWEIEFIPPNINDNMSTVPTPILASGNWTQPQGEYIAAFDVSIRDAGNTQFILGRSIHQYIFGHIGKFCCRMQCRI